MKQKDMVTKSQTDTFIHLEYLLATIRKLFGKAKLGSSLVYYASCLNRSHLTNLVPSSESFKLLIN